MPWHLIKLKSALSIKRKAYDEAVQNWLFSLERFDHILSGYSLVWKGKDSLFAEVEATRLDSLKLDYFNKYVRKDFDNVLAVSSKRPSISLSEYEPQRKWKDWKKSDEFYLFTTYFHLEPSLREGRTGVPIPIYQLPIDPDQSEQIKFWTKHYQDFDAVQLSCGALEIPAYRQLAEVGSELTRHGRDLCKTIESATGKATYYFLMRYWGWPNKKKEQNRVCPNCGKPWKNRHRTKTGIGRFDFKCSPCRLVSQVCSTDDEAKFAEIGVYKGSKRSP
jgi:predicted  nucleic acid-binding Zn ribbon protein